MTTSSATTAAPVTAVAPRRYVGVWSWFVDWSAGTDHNPLPASQATVLAYLDDGQPAAGTAGRWLAAITATHRAAGAPNPCVGVPVRCVGLWPPVTAARCIGWLTSPRPGRPVRLVWRQRTWRCAETLCPGRALTERAARLARPRALLTVRACWWAIGQMRREHASVQGLAHRLGCSWRTVWTSIEPMLEKMAADESRFDGVTALGVDEHI